MSTKDNSKKKQNKGFIALLVEKARNIFDTEESKTENTKKASVSDAFLVAVPHFQGFAATGGAISASSMISAREKPI